MTDTANSATNELEAPTNALAEPETADKFQGFATKDGERVTPQAAPDPRKAVAPKQGGESKVQGDSSKKDDDSEETSEANERHKSAQARINKAVGRQRAAERRADALEARLVALESQMRSGQQTQQTRTEPKGPPQPKDFEYGELDAAYIRELARYEARQEFEASTNRARQTQQSQYSAQQQHEVQARLDAFYTRGLDIADDFEEVVSDQGLKISPVLGELVLESEFGPQIAYAMASDPKEAKRVSAMSPARQAAWFGNKEAELSSESSGAEEDPEDGQQIGRSPNNASPKTTKAPPPPKGKTRGSGGTQQVSPATTDFAQFERLAMKQQE